MIRFFWLPVVRFLLWLRYRIRIRGVREVAAKGARGILFLPNHPALVDPVILASRLYGPFRTRPLADRDQIDRPLIRGLTRRIGVLPIPDLAKGGAAAADEVRTIVGLCVDALRRGDNLILYPSGRNQRTRLEDIGGNSAVETILRDLPEVRVVLVRTRGLWGSRFGWASGRRPSVAAALGRGAKALLASGVFFAPRRDVSIELVEPEDLPRGADRATLNQYLEAFYNRDAPANTYVPYSIWERGGVRQAPEPRLAHIEGDPSGVPEATRRIVRDQIEALTGAGDFDDASRLAHDLGMDSLSRVDLLLWLQSEFGFPQGDTESLVTVGDVMLAACGEAVAAGPAALGKVSAAWLAKVGDPSRAPDLGGMTLCEAFLAQARRWPGKVILADQTSGVKTYRDLVLAVMVLKRHMARVAGERVGIMMPASVAATTVYLAALFAGKVPVMVNWTQGRQNLLHCLDSAGVRQVVTARALVARLESQGVELDCVADRLVYLEDIGAAVSRWAKVGAWLRSRLWWAELRRARAPETAVILFTSGSETVPKAVPLTHRNLLTNVSDACEAFTFDRGDSILGILPPFHAFGLTTSAVLPLCLGLRAVYYPNPTDGGALGRMVEAYRASILIGTPTFLSGIVRASSVEQLRSLRLVVTGAETCPPRVYEAVAQRCPGAEILEGYGVTECSPIISANHQGESRPGTIGRAMASLETVLVEPERYVRSPAGQGGMLLVRGPSVFGGYLDYDGPSPFVEFEGRLWYRTGDLVTEADDGVLSFAGRLKRFVKLGGEMISLPAIESVLAARYGAEGDEGPVVAVAATPDDERPEIVLFTTKDIDRGEANRRIREAGLSGLHNVRRVIRVDALPLLGTGKTDYRALSGRLGGPPG